MASPELGNLMKKECLSGIFVVLTLSILSGCSKPPKNWTRAHIDVYKDPACGIAEVSTTLTDPKEVQELSTFFPHLGEHRHSPHNFGWVFKMQVVFTADDGTTVTVRTDYWEWSEGNGDWETDPKLNDYVSALLDRFYSNKPRPPRFN